MLQDEQREQDKLRAWSGDAKEICRPCTRNTRAAKKYHPKQTFIKDLPNGVIRASPFSMSTVS